MGPPPLLPSLAALLLFSTSGAFGPQPSIPIVGGRRTPRGHPGASSGKRTRDVHHLASTHHLAPTHHTSPWTRLRLANIDDDDESEWRAFRAKLVRDGLPSLDDARHSDEDTTLQNDDADVRSNCNDGYAHETTPLVEVGSVLLSIPTTDLCQALDQQYWHRSVVIITEVSDNVFSGEAENEVPEEQLAQGDRRGRWSYRGIMLNRCTDGVFPGNVNGTTGEEGRGQIVASGDGNGWRIHRGGDLLGLDSAAGTEFACLHHLGFGDPDVRSASTKLVGNLCCTTLAHAQRLCDEHPTKYRPQDFLTFGGFCKWRPRQLERELGPERREWRVLSVDGRSIWDELQLQREQSEAIIREGGKGAEVADGLLQTGTGMWRRFLQKIDVSESEATERLPSGQLAFYDQMLRVWAEEKLTVDRTDPLLHTKLEDSSKSLGPGTIVRATSPPTSDVLLYEAEFIRSLVLVIEDTSDATVGIILNHPMAAAVECREGEGPLPLRYGGPIDVPSWRGGSYKETWEDDGEDEEEGDVYEGFLDYQSGAVSFEDIAFDELGGSLGLDGDDDDSSFLWIHRDARLGWQRPNGGTRLGTSNLWLIWEDDALEALQSGSLRAEDVMVFAGVCIWEKGVDVGTCGGGLREQVDAIGSFEVIRAWNQKGNEEESNKVWDILSKRQKILSKETLDGNIAAAIDAWQAFSDGGTNAELAVPDDKDARALLSEAALKAWVGVNLLEDPLGTLVEVRDDRQRLEQ